MPLTVVDEPPVRPDFIQETVRLLAERLERERAGLLARVERTSDAELSSGTDEAWGIGQVAAHLLIVERGVLGIALRLAKGEAPDATGQPRPAARHPFGWLLTLPNHYHAHLTAHERGVPSAL